MQLIVITLPHFFDGEAALITALFDNGLQTLHLRKPEAAAGEMRALLRAIPAVYHPRIVLHDCHELGREFALRGVHLNRRHPVAPAGCRGTVSRSCHSIEEVMRWKALSDYVFLSPVFDSISKTGYRSAFTPEALKEAAAAGIIDRKVMALGGIGAGNIGRLVQWHFGGAAVLGDVWTHRSDSDFINHFKTLKAICDNPK